MDLAPRPVTAARRATTAPGQRDWLTTNWKQKCQMKSFVFVSPTPVPTSQPNLPPLVGPGPGLPPENPMPHRCTSNRPLLLLNRPFTPRPSSYSRYSRNNWTAWRPDWKPASTPKLRHWANHANHANHHTLHQTVLSPPPQLQTVKMPNLTLFFPSWQSA
jgi:hypothetical protein